MTAAERAHLRRLQATVTAFAKALADSRQFNENPPACPKCAFASTLTMGTKMLAGVMGNAAGLFKAAMMTTGDDDVTKH